MNHKQQQKMENIAKSLENKQILVVKAETTVNNKTNKSRINNQIILLGSLALGSETNFNPFIFENKKWIAIYNHRYDTIMLQCENYRIKNIIIEEFKVI